MRRVKIENVRVWESFFLFIFLFIYFRNIQSKKNETRVFPLFWVKGLQSLEFH